MERAAFVSGLKSGVEKRPPLNSSLGLWGRSPARRSLGRGGSWAEARGQPTWRPSELLLLLVWPLMALALLLPVGLVRAVAAPSGDDNLPAQMSAPNKLATDSEPRQMAKSQATDGDLNSTLALVLGSRGRQKGGGGAGDEMPEDGGARETSSRSLRLGIIRRLLVRQLTNLIMNNEPEIIADQMEGTKVSGQLSSEPLVAAPPDQPDQPAMQLAAQSADLDLVASSSQGPVGSQPPDELNEDLSPTCPPDYEDQTIGEQVGGNLSAEGQQQLMTGADSSGLLSMANSNATGQPTTGDRPPCYQPGSRMIEVITKVITPILFSIIIVVGLLGNIIVMIVILEDRKTERELTPTGLLILDLSLADLSFIIFCIPFTGWDYSVGHWVFGSTWCKMNQYLIVVCALSSIYTLVLMSVDRFMAIVYPIECMSYRTSKNTLYAIYIKWILILLLALPTISMHGIIDSPLAADQYTCRFLADQYNPLHFQVVFFVTSYLFPLILIFCLYLSLLNKLWFGSRPHGHKESTKTLESKKKVTWLVASIVVVFALCWCPIQVMLILMRLKMHKITATYVAIQVFSHTLGYMNSCVNPIVYAFASESFLNSFKRSACGRFFYWLFCLKNSHHHHHHHHQQQQQHTQLMSHTNIPPTQIDLEGFIDSTDLQRNAGQQHRTNQRLKVPGSESGAGNGSLETGAAAGASVMLSSQGIKVRPADRAGASTPVLEPRDRPAMIKQAPNSSSIDRSRSMVRDQSGPICHSTDGSPPGAGGREPTKQQLVARMDQSGSQVSHRCEPCFNE